MALTENETEKYNGKVTSFLLLSCMVATMGGVIFGYEVAITGVVSFTDEFLKKFYPSLIKMREAPLFRNYCKFDGQILTAFTSSMYVSGTFASVMAAHVTSTRGHRLTMVIGGMSSLAGAGLGGASINIWMLIVSRILVGVGLGFANQAVPLYLCEMAPPQHRGAFGIAFRLSHGIGFVLASLVSVTVRKIESDLRWRLSLSLASIPAACFTLGALILPETPIDIIRRGGSLPKTIGMLQNLRGTSEILTELEDIVTTADSSGSSASRKILQQKYRPHIVTATGIAIFAGVNPVTFYAPVFLGIITERPEERLLIVAAVVPGLVAIAANFVAMITVDRLGRRSLFVIGGALMLSSLVATGGVLMTNMSKGSVYLVLNLICIHIAGFEFSWGPLGWLVPTEIYPFSIRSVGQSTAVAANFLFAFAIAHIFGLLLCAFKSSTFFFIFFFAVWVIVMTAFVYSLLPETKNVPIERMERVWREHWFWKRMMDEHTDQPQWL